MLNVLWLGCTAVAVVSLCVHAYRVHRFAGLYDEAPPPAPPCWPNVEVILCVRGVDPTLGDCLRAINSQVYEGRYRVHVVFDGDEALAVIASAAAATKLRPQFKAARLYPPHDACGLKMSALVQALGDLEPDTEAVALIDADVRPASDWLANLIAPLYVNGVGAATGVRWFEPVGGLGSRLRYLWNAGAVVQAHAHSVAWGGSLAFQVAVLRRAGLPALWLHRLVEDTGVTGALAKIGLRVHTVPVAVALCGERVSVRDAFRFVRRQLLAVRLYHDRWPRILLHGLVDAVAVVSLFAVLVVGGWTNDDYRFAEAGVVLFVQFVAAVGGLLYLRGRINRVRGETSGAVWLLSQALPLLPLAVLFHAAAAIAAQVARRVDWRGVTYVLSRGTVRLAAYRPYRPTVSSKESLV